MSKQEITVVLGHGNSVTVEGDACRTGTQTPRNSLGGGNTETYDVVIHGMACRGEWDGDGRHNVAVDPCPAELRPLLETEAAAQRRAEELREWNSMSQRDRADWSACGMAPK